MRQLKADGASDIDVKKAVTELKARKKVLEEKVSLIRSILLYLYKHSS